VNKDEKTFGAASLCSQRDFLQTQIEDFILNTLGGVVETHLEPFLLLEVMQTSVDEDFKGREMLLDVDGFPQKFLLLRRQDRLVIDDVFLSA
jgi:hypothetical protein